MKKSIVRIILIALVLASVSMPLSARSNKSTDTGVELASPAATYKFAGRDTCDLLLDFYPAS